MENKNKYLYQEKVTSTLTTLLFIGLAIVSFGLYLWHNAGSINWDTLSIVFLFMVCFFVFYLFNFRTLQVLATKETLQLRFGLFHWTEPIDNIESVKLDQIPTLLKYGGAGIHYMTVHGRYRISFNFLEYERVCVGLKKKQGLVQDISFSTRQVEKVIAVLSKLVDDRSKE
jgi:hypothetical protein